MILKRFVAIDLSKSGRKIGEEILAALNSTQIEELTQFVLECSDKKNGTTNFLHCSIPYPGEKVRKPPFTEIRIGHIYFCMETHVVRVKEQEIFLTEKEFDILGLLISNPRRVFTYEMIMDIVWDEEYDAYSRKTIINHISNLRRKLKISPDIPDYIKSIHGVGYKFDADIG